jgi:hypothetical protein
LRDLYSTTIKSRRVVEISAVNRGFFAVHLN